MSNILQVGIKGFNPTWLLLRVPGVARLPAPAALAAPGVRLVLTSPFSWVECQWGLSSTASAAEAKQWRVTKATGALHPAHASMAWPCSSHAGQTAGCGPRSALIVWVMETDTTTTAEISAVVKRWRHLNTHVFKITIETGIILLLISLMNEVCRWIYTSKWLTT